MINAEAETRETRQRFPGERPQVLEGCGPGGRPEGALPVDPKGGLKARFAAAKSIRQSSSLSMPAHLPGRVGRDLAPMPSGPRFQVRKGRGHPLRMLIR